MRTRVAIITLLFAALFPVITPARAAEASVAPNLANVVRAGSNTLQKLQNMAASWTVKYELPNGFVIQVDVVFEKERRALTFSQAINGQAQKIGRIVELDD